MLPAYLFIVGGASVGRGILDIALQPDPDPYAVEYAHLPSSTRPDVKAKVAYGQEALEHLADRTYLVRIIDNSLTLLSGAMIIPLYLLQNDRELQVPDYFVLAGAGISMLSGIIGFFSVSDAERRWDAYQEMSGRLDKRITWRVRPSASPWGAGLSLSGEF